MITTVWNKETNILEVTASDTLSKEDYREFTPIVESLIEAEDKIRILFIMKDFHGWDVGGVWEDVKFDIQHFNDIERVALVGDRKWEEYMAMICKPFTSAAIEFFPLTDLEAAREWVRTGVLLE